MGTILPSSYTLNRRALKLASGVRITAEQIKGLAAKQLKCPDCLVSFSRANPYTVDHIMPLALGGQHLLGNIELRCKPCNSTKSWKDPIVYAHSLGRLL